MADSIKRIDVGKPEIPLIKSLTKEQLSDMREAFDLFDKDGDETISTEEFRSLFRCFGMKVSDTEL